MVLQLFIAMLGYTFHAFPVILDFFFFFCEYGIGENPKANTKRNITPNEIYIHAISCKFVLMTSCGSFIHCITFSFPYDFCRHSFSFMKEFYSNHFKSLSYFVSLIYSSFEQLQGFNQEKFEWTSTKQFAITVSKTEYNVCYMGMNYSPLNNLEWHTLQ